MSPRNQAVELLSLAQKDYKAAVILARAEEPQMEAAGFHLQQTVEKALKALILIGNYLHSTPLPSNFDMNCRAMASRNSSSMLTKLDNCLIAFGAFYVRAAHL